MANKFLDGGDKVKLSCQFRGRENDFREIGREMFMKFLDDVGPAMVGRCRFTPCSPWRVPVLTVFGFSARS